MDMIQDWMIINKIKMGDPDAWDILVHGEDGVVLRLISREKPFANAKQVDPVLEDLYLFYFREGE